MCVRHVTECESRRFRSSHRRRRGKTPSWPSGLIIGTVPKSVALSQTGTPDSPSRGERVQPRGPDPRLHPDLPPCDSTAQHALLRSTRSLVLLWGFPRRLINQTRAGGQGSGRPCMYCTCEYVAGKQAGRDAMMMIRPTRQPSPGQVTPKGASTLHRHIIRVAISCRMPDAWGAVGGGARAWGGGSSKMDATGPVSEGFDSQRESDRQRILHERTREGEKEKENRLMSVLSQSSPAALQPARPCPGPCPCLTGWLAEAGWAGGWLFSEELAATPAKLRSSWHFV